MTFGNVDLNESMKYFRNLLGGKLETLWRVGFWDSDSGLFCVSFNEIFRGFGNECNRLIKPGRSALARVLVVFVSGLLLGGVGICGPVCAEKQTSPKIDKNTDPEILRKYVKAFDDLNRIKGPDADRFATKGQVQEWLHDYSGAAVSYDKAIELNPKYALYHLAKARALRAQDKHEAAEKEYSNAIKMGHRSSEVYYGRALSRMTLKNYLGSISDAERSIAINPKEYLAWYAKASSEKKIGRFEESIKSFSQAIKIKPEDPNLYGLRSIVYQKQGNIKSALEDQKIYESLSKKVP